jgi:hypothetical protein
LRIGWLGRARVWTSDSKGRSRTICPVDVRACEGDSLRQNRSNDFASLMHAHANLSCANSCSDFLGFSGIFRLDEIFVSQFSLYTKSLS